MTVQCSIELHNLGDENKSNKKEMDKLLAEGWRVVQMCPFSQCVALNYGGKTASCGMEKFAMTGNYGILVILEKEETAKSRKKKE